MKDVKGFIRLVTEKDYDKEQHKFTDVVEVAFKVKNISEIIEYMPDDPDYDNTNIGSKIIMTNGNEYIVMDWSIDEILGLIERES